MGAVGLVGGKDVWVLDAPHRGGGVETVDLGEGRSQRVRVVERAGGRELGELQGTQSRRLESRGDQPRGDDRGKPERWRSGAAWG